MHSLRVSNPVSNPDVLVHDAGTLFSFCPLSSRAKTWIDEHVQGEVQWFGHASIESPIVLVFISIRKLNSFPRSTPE